MKEKMLSQPVFCHTRFNELLWLLPRLHAGLTIAKPHETVVQKLLKPGNERAEILRGDHTIPENKMNNK